MGESGGVLKESAVLLHPAPRGSGEKKLAWDIQVIDPLDTERFDKAFQSPFEVADAWREWFIAHHDTSNRCENLGWKYEPMVFTREGDVQREVDSALTFLASAVASAEGKDAAVLKKEIMHALMLSLPSVKMSRINAFAPGTLATASSAV